MSSRNDADKNARAVGAGECELSIDSALSILCVICDSQILETCQPIESAARQRQQPSVVKSAVGPRRRVQRTFEVSEKAYGSGSGEGVREPPFRSTDGHVAEHSLRLTSVQGWSAYRKDCSAASSARCC